MVILSSLLGTMIKLISAVDIQIDINCKVTMNKDGKDDNKNEVNRIIAKWQNGPKEGE